VSRTAVVRALPVALLALYVVLGLVTLTTFPLVWVDEGWYVSSAANFVRDGSFALPLFGDLDGFDRDNVVYGRIYLLALAAAFTAADVTPEAARLVSFTAGIAAVVSMFALGRELWDARVGVVAAILLAVSPVFIDQSHDARPEIMQLAFTLAAFASLLAGQRRSSALLLVLAGVLAVLAADVHLNAVIVPVALAAVLLVRRASLRTFGLFAAGGFVAGLWFLFVHVVQDPALFMQQVNAFGGPKSPLSEFLERPAFTLGMGLARYIRVDAGSLALLVAGLIATYELLRRHNDLALRTVLTFAGVQLIYTLVLVNHKQPVYAVLLWPVLALLVARLLTVLPQRLAVLAGGTIIVISLLSVGHMTLRDRGADFDSYLAQLDAAIPDDAVVMGQPSTWFGFTEQPYVASQYFVFRTPFAEEMRNMGVEYVIADEYLTDLQLYHLEELPADEVERFLEDHGEIVAEIEDPHYGRYQTGVGRPILTRVYRIEGAGPSDQS
jgi:4-amino-4-deoxy-L-arabinose transferase-like glycosyltransferase